MDAASIVNGLVIWISLKDLGIRGFCLVFIVIGRGDIFSSGISRSCMLTIQGAGVASYYSVDFCFYL